MSLFIVSLDTKFCVEASDAETAKVTALKALSEDDVEAREADENDALRFDSKCRPWTLDARGYVKLSSRTCDEIVFATIRERERLEQEQEAADA